MYTSIKPETHLSVLFAHNGLIVFQGFRKQALFVSREEIPRFIRDPEQSIVRIIPPYAALAIHCYLALGSFDLIELTLPFDHSEEYSLTMPSAHQRAVRFYSDHDHVPAARILRAENIGVVVTPKATLVIDHSDLEPTLTPVVELPAPEVPDYPGRFAHDKRLLQEAVLRTTNNLNPGLHYEP